jgi:DNA-binding MarR family transcriptional regulator
MSSETNQGFEQELVAYERLRHQKHSAHHLSPQQILVLRRVVNSGCLERHALISPELCDSSLSRTVSYLAKHKLVRPTIDNCDGRKRILYSTRAGERLIAKLDAEAAARKNESHDPGVVASSTSSSTSTESPVRPPKGCQHNPATEVRASCDTREIDAQVMALRGTGASSHLPRVSAS